MKTSILAFCMVVVMSYVNGEESTSTSTTESGITTNPTETTTAKIGQRSYHREGANSGAQAYQNANRGARGSKNNDYDHYSLKQLKDVNRGSRHSDYNDQRYANDNAGRHGYNNYAAVSNPGYYPGWGGYGGYPRAGLGGYGAGYGAGYGGRYGAYGAYGYGAPRYAGYAGYGPY